MKAVILAANDNTLLRPLNLRKPSALIKINGIPLLEHQIRGYNRAGVETASISVVSGYQHGQVKRYLTREHHEIRLVRNPDYRSTSALHSLDLAVRSAPPTADEELFISSGQCIYDDAAIKRVSRVTGSAIAVDSSRLATGLTKVIAEDGNVVRIGTHILNHAATAVTTGLCKLDARARTVLSNIAAERAAREGVTPMADALGEVIRRAQVRVVDIAGTKWAALRTMDDVQTADRRFSRFSLSGKRCFVLDLDGTVYVGARPICGSVAFINRNVDDRAFYFVTNNTSKLPEDYRRRLNALGIPADAEHVVTPLAPLITYLREHTITHVCLLANARIIAYLQGALPGLELTADPEACEALIVTYDTELTYDKLRDAALLLQQSPRLKFLATHGDLVCPTEHGFVPDSGCILSVLEQATRRTPDTVFGKPNPLLLERVTAQYRPGQMVVVGDRLYTDRQMARNVGCDFICVLSGETTRERIDELSEDEFPSLIVKDLGDLLT
jgi:HAD superfamily hydrolase (TIGR01450 family)